jgi:nucleoside-diphosphate-sugar epimerase
VIPLIFTYFPPQPTIHEIEKLERLNTSSQLWYEQVIKNTSGSPDLAKSVGSYVDVRDVALANVLATEKEAAGGERILVPTGRSNYHRVSG